MLKNTLLVFITTLSVLFSSCNLISDLSEVEDLKIAPSFIFPLVKIKIDIDQLTSLSSIEGTQEFNLTDLDAIDESQVGQGDFTVGPINEEDVYSEDISDDLTLEDIGELETVLVDVETQLTISNPSALTIGAGSELELLNSLNQPIANILIDQDILPGSSFPINTTFENISLDDGLVFNIAKIVSPGGTVNLTEANRYIDIDYEFNLTNIEELSFNFSEDYIYRDSSDFDLFSDGEDETDIYGDLNLKLTNSIPLSGTASVILTSKTGQPDFVLSSFDVDAATQNTDGSVTPNTSNGTLLTIDDFVLSRLKDGEEIIIELAIPATNQTVSLDQSSSLDIKLIIDGTIETTL